MAAFVVLLFTLLALLHYPCEVDARVKPEIDVKKYSYICLAARQDLCLGISPGEGDPFYDPLSIFGIQVKSRLNNEFTGQDYKKTRWDVDYFSNTIALSRFRDLCIAKVGNKNDVILSPCGPLENARPQDTYGLWDLKFQDNENWEGTLELIGFPRRLCLTLVDCGASGRGYCDETSETVSLDFNVFKKGSYVKIKPCWDDPINGGLETWRDAQIWRQKLDCAVGCPPLLLLNGVCNSACDVEECGFDNGECRTMSPTPPTPRPTAYPSSSPTKFPITVPTNAPSKQPTWTPTTKNPSTGFPTSAPSKTPTEKVTVSPTDHPTFPCPSQDLFKICAKFNRNSCIKKPIAKLNCVYCLGKCSPRGEERACQEEGFYDHCKPECPTYDQFQTCPKFTSVRQCKRTPFGRKNCSWCGDRCIAGKNLAACSASSFYDHCDPNKVPCPKVEQFSMCENIGSNERTCKSNANQRNCVWCPSLNQCMAGTRAEVCTVPDFYSHCPTTHAPTNAPTLTMSPTFESQYETYDNETITASPTVPVQKPECPSPAMIKGCRDIQWNNQACNNSPFGKRNCVWCPVIGCRPGKRIETCTNPLFYNHCN